MTTPQIEDNLTAAATASKYDIDISHYSLPLYAYIKHKLSMRNGLQILCKCKQNA